MTPQPEFAPLSVGELLRRYPPGRITGWDPANPPGVERAFRGGYAIGARRLVESRGFGFAHDEPGDTELATNLNDVIHRRRGDLYDSDHWSDRRAALLRGSQHGLLDAVRARAAGVSVMKLVTWLDELREWAAEEPPQLDWASAKPPDPPDPDGPPLGRDGVPKGLWGVAFGSWTMVDALSAPVTLVRQRGPFIRSKEQYERMRAAELAKLRERIRAHKGEFTASETLGQYEPEVQAVWHEELAARATRVPGPVLVRVADVQPELVRWLWPGRIALGKLTLLAGDPGLGKSFITLDLTQDLPALEAAIQQTSDSKLVVIDPLTAYLDKTDGHKNAEVHAILARLFELAAKHKVAVLAVTHLNKASTLPAIYRAMGSLAFVAAARAVWAVVRDDDDETGRLRLFVPVKNNLGADETGLAYALEPVGQTARVKWESDPVNVRADEALDGGGRKAKVQHDARQFVIDMIKANGGDMLSEDLATAAKDHGITEITHRRARKAVAISYKEPAIAIAAGC